MNTWKKKSVLQLFERHKNKNALKISKYLQFRLQKSKWEAVVAAEASLGYLVSLTMRPSFCLSFAGSFLSWGFFFLRNFVCFEYTSWLMYYPIRIGQAGVLETNTWWGGESLINKYRNKHMMKYVKAILYVRKQFQCSYFSATSLQKALHCHPNVIFKSTNTHFFFPLPIAFLLYQGFNSQ